MVVPSTTAVFVMLTALSCAAFLVRGDGEALSARDIRTSPLSGDSGEEVENGGRKGKILPIFQIMRFPNDPCVTGEEKNGTCFTAAECTSRNGANAGSCAGGFGVCCTFTINCGGMSSENCTYFDSNAIMAGACSATICPCGNDICQLRLDFNTFVITGPSTESSAVTKRVQNSGTIGFSTPATDLIPVAEATQCLTDYFSVSSGGGINPPTICGTNTGDHMYVEADAGCNTLDFQFNPTAEGTILAQRSFSIKVTQFNCGFSNLAPQGCTQYFFGSNTNTLRSFNYNSGNSLHLANQNQQICIRRERSTCRICYTTMMDNDFAVSGNGNPDRLNAGNLCCSYGALNANTGADGFDCVQIVGARTNGNNGNPAKSNICGNGGLKVNADTPAGTICSITSPFRINFRSDSHEVVNADAPTNSEAELAAANRGFNLVYFLDAINCNPGQS